MNKTHVPSPNYKEIKKVAVNNVLTMIKSHVDKDDEAFQKAAVTVAAELLAFNEEELALYIYAQFNLIPTFVPQ